SVSEIRRPRHPVTITIVLYGSLIADTNPPNSAGSNIRGRTSRLLPPFTRTSAIGFFPISSHLIAHWNSRCSNCLMCEFVLGASFNPLNHASTAMGLTFSSKVLSHLGLMWQSRYDRYPELVANRFGISSASYLAIKTPIVSPSPTIGDSALAPNRSACTFADLRIADSLGNS